MNVARPSNGIGLGHPLDFQLFSLGPVTRVAGCSKARSRFAVSVLSILVALVAIMATTAGASPPVLVVRSSSRPSLGAALAGLRETCAYPVDVVQLEGDDLEDRKTLGDALARDPAAVVSLGGWAAGLVADLAPPQPTFAGFAGDVGDDGRVITGVPPPALEIEQLLRIDPRVKSIGVLYDGASSEADAADIEAAAKARKLRVVAGPVRGPTDLPRVFSMLADRVQAVLLIPDRTIVGSQEAISYLVLGCLEKNVLLYTRSEVLVRGGALFTVVVDPTEVGRSLGRMVTRVLSTGASAAATPKLEAASFELVVNHKTARALGLALGPELLPLPTSGDLVRVDLGRQPTVSERFVPARIVEQRPAEVPAGAADRLPAVVVLRIRVSRDGAIAGVVVLSGEAPFTGAALKAVEGWKFEPARSAGRSVDSSLVVTVSFEAGG